MKIALITAGLLATAVSQASPALARGGPLHLWAPSSYQQVKPDVRAHHQQQQKDCVVHYLARLAKYACKYSGR